MIPAAIARVRSPHWEPGVTHRSSGASMASDRMGERSSLRNRSDGIRGDPTESELGFSEPLCKDNKTCCRPFPRFHNTQKHTAIQQKIYLHEAAMLVCEERLRAMAHLGYF